MLIPNPAFHHAAWIFSLNGSHFDTPETSKYIFHTWRIMVISFSSFIIQSKFRRGKFTFS